MISKYKIRYTLLVPIIISIIMLAQWLFFIDTPLNVNNDHWIQTEATIIKIEDTSYLEDDAKGRVFFRNQVATVSYTNEKGEIAEGYIFEFDRHFDQLFRPVGSEISIQYNKETGATSRLWYAVFFKYAFVIIFILTVFIGLRLLIKKIRKTF